MAVLRPPVGDAPVGIAIGNRAYHPSADGTWSIDDADADTLRHQGWIDADAAVPPPPSRRTRGETPPPESAETVTEG